MFLLEPGKTYTVKLTVKNTSMRGGFPVAATLKVGISAEAGSTVLITAQEAAQEFSAGESMVFEYSLNVPTSVSGSGTIAAWVKDPAGNTLASGAEDVEIAPAGLDIGKIDILGINDKQFTDAGVDPDGIPYGKLATPFSVSRLGALTVRFYNKEVSLNQDNFVDFIFYLRYQPTWDAGYPCNSPPSFRGWSGLNLQCYSPQGCPPGSLQLRPPYGATSNINNLFGDGYWCTGLYDGDFEWALRYFDQPLGPVQGRFRVKNLVYCTTSGGPYR